MLCQSSTSLTALFGSWCACVWVCVCLARTNWFTTFHANVCTNLHTEIISVFSFGLQCKSTCARECRWPLHIHNNLYCSNFFSLPPPQFWLHSGVFGVVRQVLDSIDNYRLRIFSTFLPRFSFSRKSGWFFLLFFPPHYIAWKYFSDISHVSYIRCYDFDLFAFGIVDSLSMDSFLLQFYG